MMHAGKSAGFVYLKITFIELSELSIKKKQKKTFK